MNLVISKCVTAVKVSNFSGRYLRNRSTLDIGVLGYIGKFNSRNTLPKYFTFLLGHPVYKRKEIYTKAPSSIIPCGKICQKCYSPTECYSCHAETITSALTATGISSCSSNKVFIKSQCHWTVNLSDSRHGPMAMAPGYN